MADRTEKVPIITSTLCRWNGNNHQYDEQEHGKSAWCDEPCGLDTTSIIETWRIPNVQSWMKCVFSLSLVSGIVLCCVYCVMCWCGPFTRSSLFFSLLAARILHIPTSILGASDRSKQIVFHPLQSTLFLLPGYKAIPQLDDWNAVTNIIISMMSNNDDKLLNKFP